MPTLDLPFAALILAHDAPGGASLPDRAVGLMRSAGATPVVITLPPAVAAPAQTRVVRIPPRGSTIGAIRLGMAQLTNTTARAAIVYPLGGALPSPATIVALLERAARAPLALVAVAGVSLDRSPLLVPRDAWLELVTVGEQGIEAVASRRVVERVPESSG